MLWSVSIYDDIVNYPWCLQASVKSWWHEIFSDTLWNMSCCIPLKYSCYKMYWREATLPPSLHWCYHDYTVTTSRDLPSHTHPVLVENVKIPHISLNKTEKCVCVYLPLDDVVHAVLVFACPLVQAELVSLLHDPVLLGVATLHQTPDIWNIYYILYHIDISYNS